MDNSRRNGIYLCFVREIFYLVIVHILIVQFSFGRSGAGVGSLDGYLYAICGEYFNEEGDDVVRRSVERFGPLTKTWSPVTDLSIGRENAGYCYCVNIYFNL